MKHKVFVVAVLTLLNLQLIAQEKDRFTEVKANLLFGLNQPLIGGFNVETNLFYKRLAFDFSHGVSLNLDNPYLDDVNKAQELDVHIPWTTGFGIGYRFNDWLNLRAEPKWHKFELYYSGQNQKSESPIVSYTTFSFGLGLYANFQPFKNKDNFLKGIMIAPSVRWWPKLSSSLADDSYAYLNERLGEDVVHDAMEVGISNTPLILNVSIGYSLGWEK